MSEQDKKILDLELQIAFYKNEIYKCNKANIELEKQLRIGGVSNFKPDETLELLEEIMTKVKNANEEVENGIYDPMLEVAKHILNNYKIERR